MKLKSSRPAPHSLQFFQLKIYPFAATQTHQLQLRHSVDGHFDRRIKSVFMVFLRQSGHREFCQNDRLLVRMQLAGVSH